MRTLFDERHRYFILRLVSLTATHDRGKKGLSDKQVQQIIDKLRPYGQVYISTERPLPPCLVQHKLPVQTQDILHALAFADLFIGDSQTMTTEAALLGTPAIRCNDFVGRIHTMEWLESKYQLMYGFRPDQFDRMLAIIDELLAMPNRKLIWQLRRQRLLEDTEDVNRFIIRTIEQFQEPVYVRNRRHVQQQFASQQALH